MDSWVGLIHCSSCLSAGIMDILLHLKYCLFTGILSSSHSGNDIFYYIWKSLDKNFAILENVNIQKHLIIVCVFQTFGTIAAALVIGCAGNFWMGILLVPLIIGVVLLRYYYCHSARDIKVIEGRCKSSLYFMNSYNLGYNNRPYSHN